MPVAAHRADPRLELVNQAREAAGVADALLADATRAVRARVTREGQVDIGRRADLGLSREEVAARMTAAVENLIESGNTGPNRARLVELIREQQAVTVGDCGLDDTLDAIREEMRKFAETEVVPHAHDWHLTNSYIPIDVIAHMAELGVFGLTIPEEYGGMGLGKESMCVVSEELSRGYIG